MSSVIPVLETEVTRLLPTLTATRRAIHEHPERGLEEVRNHLNAS